MHCTMKPETGRKMIDIAMSYVGCHYLHGAYGAAPPDQNGAISPKEGSPVRKGSVNLLADPKRLDPKITDPRSALGVFAAWSEADGYAVCGGNWSTVPGGRWTAPNVWDLTNYLDGLKKKKVSAWEPYFKIFTPRRTYGPGTTGEVYWGEDCRNTRHFDCVGYVNFCMWQVTNVGWQLKIKAWAEKPNPPGGRVYELDKEKPSELQDGDIVVKIADHEHIGIVAADGTIYQAEETKAGVTDRGRFSLADTGGWTHLVRLPI